MTDYRIPPAKITAAKNFSCVDILDYFGHVAVLEKTNGELVYFSPFRNERTPSFYVNRKANVFYDHGDPDRKGDAISLYIYLSGKRFQTAVFELTENKFGRFVNNKLAEYSPIKVKESGIEVLNVFDEVRSQNLLLFANERGISTEVLNTYCGTMQYRQKSTNKTYSSITFKNDAQGFELRSAGFKSCFGTKSISTIAGNDELLVFEGFFDFLSFCQMHAGTKGRTAIILNSLSNLKKIKFKNFTKVFHFLDNDKAGTAAKERIKLLHPNTQDWSHMYFGYNDLNERLIANLQNNNG
jgi:DNA primase